MTKDNFELDGEPLTEQEKKNLEYLTKQGFTPTELKEFVQGLQKQESHLAKNHYIGGNKSKFILFSDTHFGNINYRPQIMKFLSKTAKKNKVDFVAHAGDVFDGWYQNRPSSIFEQNAIGFDQQMNMAVNELSQLEVPLYFITGNHSYNTFVRGAGIEAGPYLEKRLKDKGLEAKFLGNAEGDIDIGKTKLRLLHPDGGTAYALSYKPQKIIEALESGKKPNILSIGHFHKADYMYYRNVHAYQAGCLLGQTKYMKGKGIAAMLGFWEIDLNTKKNGQIDKIQSTFYPFYK